MNEYRYPLKIQQQQEAMNEEDSDLEDLNSLLAQENEFDENEAIDHFMGTPQLQTIKLMTIFS